MVEYNIIENMLSITLLFNLTISILVLKKDFKNGNNNI